MREPRPPVAFVPARERELTLLPLNLSLRPGILLLYTLNPSLICLNRGQFDSRFAKLTTIRGSSEMCFFSPTTVRPSSSGFRSDGGNTFYTLSEPDHSKHQTRPLSSTSLVQLVHDAGDCHAEWRIDEAFLKVQV